MPLVAVRLHAYAGAALLALAIPLLVLEGAERSPFPANASLVAILGGLTLLAQTAAFWYLPSFAKREVVLPLVAAYAGPILFPLASLAAFAGAPPTAAALGLALFGLALLASAFLGAPWRGGVPFWRVAGAFQAGDRAAAFALASSALWMVAALGLALLPERAFSIAWPVALLLFAAGALAHYVPRNRGRAILALPFAVGVLIAQAGAILLVMNATDRVGAALLLGAAIAGLAIAPPGRTKPRGSRWRDAAPFLTLALPLCAIAPALAIARWPLAAHGALVAASGFALLGLALLTFPVVFNRPPARGWVKPTTIALVAGIALHIAASASALPRWPGALALATGLAGVLLTLAPLRTPRRFCPPGDTEAS